MLKQIFITTLILISASTSLAWDKVRIPDAVCADGLPYSVYVQKGSTKTLMIEFMGGGACWSASTCWGPNLRTVIHPIPRFLYPSLTTSHRKDNPYRDATRVFVSYCTGDVFTGSHDKWYFPFTLVHHQGYANTEKALAYLNDQHIVDFSSFGEVYLGGSSAGAIGAVVHAKNVEKYVAQDALKILMIDSPGLHFGKTFWDKWSEEQIQDFTKAFAGIHLYPSVSDGFVAPYMGPVLEYLNQWKIGVMQATRDVVMSTAFGDITQDEHAALVLGPQGIAEIAKPYANTKVWIAESHHHAFLIFDSEKKGPEQETAIEFMNSLITNARRAHYRGH